MTVAGIVGWALVAWRRANWLLGLSFRLFNRGFDITGTVYTWMVGKMLRV